MHTLTRFVRACAWRGTPGIYAYVTLKDGHAETPELLRELKGSVRTHVGPFAAPDVIQLADNLPKTRSGKIMRRILRKIAANEVPACSCNVCRTALTRGAVLLK